MQVPEKAETMIRRFDMIREGDAVFAGVSGGADSVCLLLVLDALAKKQSPRPFMLSAVHVNHNLRGEESDADAAFVAELCRRLEIPLYTYSCPVAAIAVERKTGLEEAGRCVRLLAYRDCMARHGATKIALAHHANDLAETVLFRACRGSSLTGLAGIRPVQELSVPDVSPIGLTAARAGRQDEAETGSVPPGAAAGSAPGKKAEPSAGSSADHREEITIIRPLLGVTREEVEDYLTAAGQSWRTDRTNADTSYARNGIRRDVIPYLEEHVNAGTVYHLSALAEDAALADAFLASEAERRSHAVFRRTAEGIILTDACMREPEILQTYMVHMALGELSGSAKDLGREQILRILELFGKKTGSCADLPYRMAAVRDPGGVLLTRTRTQGNWTGSGEAEEIPVTGSGEMTAGSWHFAFSLEVPESGRYGKIPQLRYTKWFDYDKIKANLVLRRRLPGDRICVTPEGGTKKLKDYLIDEKIPQRKRDSLLLLAAGHRVFWVVGYRIGEDCRVTDDTRRVLRVSAEPEDKNGKKNSSVMTEQTGEKNE